MTKGWNLKPKHCQSHRAPEKQAPWITERSSHRSSRLDQRISIYPIFVRTEKTPLASCKMKDDFHLGVSFAIRCGETMKYHESRMCWRKMRISVFSAREVEKKIYASCTRSKFVIHIVLEALNVTGGLWNVQRYEAISFETFEFFLESTWNSAELSEMWDSGDFGSFGTLGNWNSGNLEFWESETFPNSS